MSTALKNKRLCDVYMYSLSGSPFCLSPIAFCYDGGVSPQRYLATTREVLRPLALDYGGVPLAPSLIQPLRLKRYYS